MFYGNQSLIQMSCYFQITLPQPGDLIRDLTVESEDVQVLGSIPEGGNAHVNARRIELPEGFNSGGSSYINLVALLTYLITVCLNYCLSYHG